MFEHWIDIDLQKMPRVEKYEGNEFSYDDGAHLFGVRVYNNGSSVTLSGSVKAYVTRANGTTYEVNGTRSGNTAYAVLPDDAYVVGRIGVFIKLINGSEVTTLGAFETYVYPSRTANLLS